MGNQGGSFGSFVSGMVIGAGIGATWALLNAPRSGEETQRKLKEAAGELRKEAGSVVSTAKTHVQEAQKELSGHAEEIGAEGKAAMQETKEVLTRVAQDVKKGVQSGAAEAQSMAQKVATDDHVGASHRSPGSVYTSPTR